MTRFTSSEFSRTQIMRPVIKRNKERFIRVIKRIFHSPLFKKIAVLSLVVYSCFLPIYNIWRCPDNVYEEMYWSAIDCSSLSAVTMRGGFFFPSDYLPAFLNLFKNSNITDMGAVQNSGTYASVERYRNGDYVWRDVDGTYNLSFSSYYGRYIYECDEYWELESGRHVRLNLVELNRDSLKPSRTLYVRFILMNEANSAENIFYERKGKSGPTVNVKSAPPVDVSLKYDFDTKQITGYIWHCSHISDEESFELVNRVLSEVLFSNYFDANPDSKFTQGDSGQWNWGEIEFGASSESYEPEKDHG